MHLPCKCCPYSVTLKKQKAQTVRKGNCLKSSILSGNLPLYTEICQTVCKFFRLARNIACCPKSSNLYRNLLDCPEIFKTLQNIFQTVRQSSRLCRNFPFFHTVWKSSRLLRSLPDCPEIFKTVQIISQTVQKYFRLHRNSPDSPEIFQTLWKFSELPKIFKILNRCFFSQKFIFKHQIFFLCIFSG